MNWLAKVASAVLIELLPKLASFIVSLVKRGWEKFKRKKSNDKAVEDLKKAETKDEFDEAVDNLP